MSLGSNLDDGEIVKAFSKRVFSLCSIKCFNLNCLNKLDKMDFRNCDFFRNSLKEYCVKNDCYECLQKAYCYRELKDLKKRDKWGTIRINRRYR